MIRRIKQMLAAIVVLLLVSVMGLPALAVTYTRTSTLFWPKASLGKTFCVYFGGISDPSQVKVSSNNSKVMSALKPRKTTRKKDGDTAKYRKVVCELKVKKYGTVTVTSTEKKDSGETTIEKTTWKIKEYSNAISSLKIGSKQYSSKYTKKTICEIPKKNISGKKCTVKTKKGWKITGINYLSADGTKLVYLKNGFKRSFLKGDEIGIVLENGEGEHLMYSIIVK